MAIDTYATNPIFLKQLRLRVIFSGKKNSNNFELRGSVVSRIFERNFYLALFRERRREIDKNVFRTNQ